MPWSTGLLTATWCWSTVNVDQRKNDTDYNDGPVNRWYWCWRASTTTRLPPSTWSCRSSAIVWRTPIRAWTRSCTLFYRRTSGRRSARWLSRGDQKSTPQAGLPTVTPGPWRSPGPPGPTTTYFEASGGPRTDDAPWRPRGRPLKR